MCGIYGELLLATGASLGDGQAATDRLEHRGPDERGTWQDERAFLGMRRLSIIDLAGGQQPIFNENETLCIIYNGELYNYVELRDELRAHGHVFRTNSDTEVILHAYEQWGRDCPKRFNGMFAFAIYNLLERSFFIARDRIGEKPLYFYRDDARLVFASEIKAMLTNDAIERELSPTGLSNYLAFGHALAPETIYTGISKLLPGHHLEVSSDRFVIERYWDVTEADFDGLTNLSESDYAQMVLELLDDSVRRRMVADVPVGAFLSGGVDSSAVVSLMKAHASGPVKTFSLGFTMGGGYNELSDARVVAEHLGTEHHELLVEHVDLVDTLRDLVYHYDEPFGDAAGFPIYLLSRFAREHVKVVLAGDGGDELFGGYRRYAVDDMARAYQRLPRAVTESLLPGLARSVPRLRRIKRGASTLQIENPALRYAEWLRVFSPDMQAELLRDDLLERVVDHDPAALYPRYYGSLNGGSAADHVNRLMYVDLKSWLVDTYMEKTDKATMAASLEARLPLLDHRLVELAFAIPGRFKIRGLSTKRILKRAVKDLVPASVLRKRKHGFAVPTDPWFRGALKSFAFDVLLDDRARSRNLFNSNVVERLWREHSEGREVWDTQLWLLLNLELWHQAFLDREAV